MSPSARLRIKKQQLKETGNKLDNLFMRLLDKRKHTVKLYAEKLEGFSPLKKIQSGYAYVTDKEDRNVKSISGISTGDLLNIRVTDGIIRSVAQDIIPLNGGN